MWGKTMDSVFWNSEGISLVGFLERVATISSAERYVRTLKKLKNEFEGFGQTVRIKFSSCTTPVRTPVCTQGSQLQQWCGLLSLVLPTVPFSTLLFVSLKNALQRRRFADDSVREELRLFSKEFYANVIHTLTQRWKINVLMMKETL